MSLHVQKSFPPELLRRWRKVMKERRSFARNFESEIAQREREFDRWKLSQQRQSWWYAAIGLPALGLIVGLLVAGGCR